jgi:hypothetical protein
LNSFPLNFLTFPVWWYTVGIKIAFKKAQANFGYGIKKTGIVLFARHLGEPLYGDYTRTGRIVSFFLRIVLIFFKVLLLTFRGIFLIIYLLGYLIILPSLIILLIWQFLPAK